MSQAGEWWANSWISIWHFLQFSSCASTPSYPSYFMYIWYSIFVLNYFKWSSIDSTCTYIGSSISTLFLILFCYHSSIYKLSLNIYANERLLRILFGFILYSAIWQADECALLYFFLLLLFDFGYFCYYCYCDSTYLTSISI